MLLDRLLLSQNVTPSRTPPPSSVTYFMNGPFLVSAEALVVTFYFDNATDYA